MIPTENLTDQWNFYFHNLSSNELSFYLVTGYGNLIKYNISKHLFLQSKGF